MPVVAAVESVFDPVADPVFDAVFAESVFDAVAPVVEACAALSDAAAEERLGTAPEVAAEMGAARSAAAAKATSCDRENFIVNVWMCH